MNRSMKLNQSMTNEQALEVLHKAWPSIVDSDMHNAIGLSIDALRKQIDCDCNKRHKHHHHGIGFWSIVHIGLHIGLHLILHLIFEVILNTSLH